MAGWDYEVNDTRVCLLIPHRDERDWRPWWKSLMNMQLPPNTGTLEMRGFSLTTLRENLVKKALEDKTYTHFFFWDDDVIPPLDIIPTLLSYKIPIVCGLYNAKKKLGERCLAAWIDIGNHAEHKLAPIQLQQSARHVEVSVTGLGCCLIHRGVFEKLSEPWFRWDVPPAPSEDFYFFFKCERELGIRPVIDLEMKCQHIGVFSMDTEGNCDTVNM